MPRAAVLDSTVLVSAFLTPNGAADAVVEQAKAGPFVCVLSEDILAETARVLVDTPRLRQRYTYTDAEVQTYMEGLSHAALLVADPPALTGVVRDPNDDMILACAVAADALHVVTRDRDLLSLDTYAGITMLTPEAFLTLLRQ